LLSITQVEPIWADLDSAMDRLPDLADITMRIRLCLNKKSDLRRTIAKDNAADFKITNGLEAEHVLQVVNVTPRANFHFDFPALEAYNLSLADVTKFQGMVTWTRLLLSPKWDLGGVPERDGRVAQKLKKKFEEVPLSKSIRNLVGDQHFRASSDGVGETFYFIYNVAIMFHGMSI
jgi:3-oxoacyl-ACP reductase-like protein